MVEMVNNKGTDLILANQIDTLIGNWVDEIQNAYTSTRRFDSPHGTDPRRDIYVSCGYTPHGESSLENFENNYARHPVAKRVTDIMADESWVIPPRVYETENPEDQTQFEMNWRDLGRYLGEESWYQSDNNSAIWPYCAQVDRESGVGSFGGLLIGVDDEKSLEEPLEGIEQATKGKARLLNEGKKSRELIYLRVFRQRDIRISDYDRNSHSPRYMQPTKYLLTFRSYLAGAETTEQQEVHWTRFLHVPSSGVGLFGPPRQQVVENQLYDLLKLYGGSAEMYWLGALPGLHIGTHPSLGTDANINMPSILGALEQYRNSLERALITKGMAVNSLAPQVSSPLEQVQVAIQAVSIGIDVPEAIFTGSARSKESGDKDTRRWNANVQRNQLSRCTPTIAAPLTNRFIASGILTAPKKYYSMSWTDLNLLTEDEKAEVSFKRMKTIVAYIKGDGFRLINPLDFLSRLLSWDIAEAKDIIARAKKEKNPLGLLDASMGTLRPDGSTTPAGAKDNTDDPASLDKGLPKKAGTESN